MISLGVAIIKVVRFKRIEYFFCFCFSSSLLGFPEWEALLLL